MRTLLRASRFKYYSYTLIIVICFLSSCSEFIETNTPKLEITSIISKDDGVTVIGKITDDGNLKISSLGVKIRTSYSNEHWTNIQLPMSNKDFCTTIPNLEYDNSYYIKAYAVNDEGSTETNEQQFKTSVSTQGPPNIPCTLTDNYLQFDERLVKVDWSNTGIGTINTWYYGMVPVCYYSNVPNLKIEFKLKPNNGVYSTTDWYKYLYTGKNVLAYVVDGTHTYLINEGCKIYVTLTNETPILSFCELEYKDINNVIHTISGSFQ